MPHIGHIQNMHTEVHYEYVFIKDVVASEHVPRYTERLMPCLLLQHVRYTLLDTLLRLRQGCNMVLVYGIHQCLRRSDYCTRKLCMDAYA